MKLDVLKLDLDKAHDMILKLHHLDNIEDVLGLAYVVGENPKEFNQEEKITVSVFLNRVLDHIDSIV